MLLKLNLVNDVDYGSSFDFYPEFSFVVAIDKLSVNSLKMDMLLYIYLCVTDSTEGAEG
jgi:hypothetical protein